MKIAGIPEKLRAKLTVGGGLIKVRVTPKASRNRIETAGDDSLRVYVTVAPEGGKANRAVVKLLAKTLGTAQSDLDLIRGETSRNKVFRVR